MKTILYFLAIWLPWPLRRLVLTTVFGYKLDPKSRIGFSWIMPEQLVMDRDSSIGALTVCRGIKLLHLKQSAYIGRGNWITGFPSGEHKHFAHQPDRRPELVVGEHSAITNRHILDCTNSVTIGAFTTFGGFRSQILTHSIDLRDCRQSSAPISIGDYSFIGTDCVLLGGSSLPHHSVLGAKSLLNKPYTEPFWLYGGAPARPIEKVPPDARYFKREVGFVY
jgi:acetyltransferase-like isoleucine patch superfamily enzyme